MPSATQLDPDRPLTEREEAEIIFYCLGRKEFREQLQEEYGIPADPSEPLPIKIIAALTGIPEPTLYRYLAQARHNALDKCVDLITSNQTINPNK